MSSPYNYQHPHHQKKKKEISKPSDFLDSARVCRESEENGFLIQFVGSPENSVLPSLGNYTSPWLWIC